MEIGFKVLPDEDVIAAKCLNMQDLALSKKVKVGCIVEGFHPGSHSLTHELDYQYFGGANIEFSTSDVFHAEVVAILDCVMNRHLPIRIFVTSQSDEENVFLCGHCRQLLLEINKDCQVIVLNPNGSVKGMKTVSELLPNHKDVTKKNEMWKNICRIQGRFDIDWRKF